jgi:hypothetical protein
MLDNTEYNRFVLSISTIESTLELDIQLKPTLVRIFVNKPYIFYPLYGHNVMIKV